MKFFQRTILSYKSTVCGIRDACLQNSVDGSHRALLGTPSDFFSLVGMFSWGSSQLLAKKATIEIADSRENLTDLNVVKMADCWMLYEK